MIDDVGVLPVSADAAEAVFGVTDAAYEKRSAAINLQHSSERVRRTDAQEHRDRDSRLPIDAITIAAIAGLLDHGMQR